MPGEPTYQRTLLGFLCGLVLGYPVSYFFQPALIQRKLSLGDYIGQMGKVLDSPYAGTAIGVWIGTAVICTIIGAIVDRKGK
jgi:hypothetical protein